MVDGTDMVSSQNPPSSAPSALVPAPVRRAADDWVRFSNTPRAVRGGAKDVDVVVFSHASVMSGGEIALLSTLRHGLAPAVHVHVDQPGPLTERLEVLPNVTWSHRLGGTETLRETSRATGMRARARTAWAMRSDYRTVLDTFPVAVIYANTLRSAVVLATLNRGGQPFIYHVRDCLSAEHMGAFNAFAARVATRWSGALVIANSQATLRAVGPSRNERYIVGSPVEETIYGIPSATDRGCVSILMLGRVTPWKGQLEFLQALSLLDTMAVGPWQARIVGGPLFGEDQYLATCREFIRDHGLSDKVQMVGHVEDVEAELGACDLLVHASVVPEPFGQVVAQGMAAGRAIVASNSGGPRELLESGVSGLLVDPTNTEALAEAIRRLVCEPDLRRRLGDCARLAAEPFRAQRVVKRLRTIVLCAQQRPTPRRKPPSMGRRS